MHRSIAIFDNGSWPYALSRSSLDIHISSESPSAIFLDILDINSSIFGICAFLFTVISLSFRESKAVVTVVCFDCDNGWTDEAIFLNICSFFDMAVLLYFFQFFTACRL